MLGHGTGAKVIRSSTASPRQEVIGARLKLASHVIPCYKEEVLQSFGISLVYLSDPLNVSRSHQIHVQGMGGGQTSSEPSTLEDRDDDLYNMAMETWIANFVKSSLKNLLT